MKTAALLASLMVLTGNARSADPSPPPAHPHAAPPAQVESFTPQGYLREVRQVQVRFNQDMVALGDPRLPDPFDIQCAAAGHGRWADTRNWEYDFDGDLDGGLSCHFTLKAQLRSTAGGVVSGQHRFTFNTGGPAIIDSLPAQGWEEISEDQVFILKLDSPATTASIDAHAWCAIEGIGERVPVQIIEGAERTAILAQSRLLAYSYYQLLWKDGHASGARVANRELVRREMLLTLLRCQRRLPPATAVTLHWGAGIAAQSGLATHSDQSLPFRVRPDFTATVECTRTNPRAGCVPMLPIDVTFSAPVPRQFALRVRVLAADGTSFPAVPAAPGVPNVQTISFKGPFPENRSLSVLLPADLVDDAGRALANAARFPLSLGMDSGPPLVKFSGEFGILESREGGVLPVTVRNVEQRLAVQRADLPAQVLRIRTDAATILTWLRRVENSQEPSGEWVDGGDSTADHPHRIWQETTGAASVFSIADRTSGFTLAPPAGNRPLQVIGIPLRKPGFYVVEIASPMLGAALLGPGKIRHVATAALVTDMAVHLQEGREASTVWVTRLSNATPVAGAQVIVASQCGGARLWEGMTDAQGLARIDTELGADDLPRRCGLIALAQAGADTSFVLSGWARGIAPSDFSLPQGYPGGSVIYHTVFDRPLFRAGEVVSMKHFIRRHILSGMEVPAAAHATHQIEIVHAGSGDHYSQEVSFDELGTASSQFQIPAEARLGTYYVSIDRHGSGTFTVAQFRLPSLRGTINAPTQVPPDARAVTFDMHVEYLSGGGAAGLAVKVRSLIEAAPLSFPAWPDYTFGGDPVQTGLRSRDGTPSDIDADVDDDGPAASVQSGDVVERARTQPLTLDGSGSARLTVGPLPKLDQAARLTAEMEYSDANGQTYTSTTHVSLTPASLVLGIKSDGWAGSAEQLRFRVLAVDLAGKPQGGRPIQVHLYQAATYSYRKRLIGGFYAYESATETKALPATCQGHTDTHGLLLCTLAPGVSGQILVRAEAATAQGGITGATTTMWCLGADELWFGGTSGDRMDLLPEKAEYSSGESARFQVRMPFREATALVSVEREGVIRSFVTTLHGNAPIIEVPLQAVDAPNVYVSVLAVRGRVAHAEHGSSAAPGHRAAQEDVTALVDLSRPAFRLGIAPIKVDWKPHRLLVRVEPAATVMKVRQTAQVHIHISTEDGTALPAGTQVAVAGVDEALLGLKENGSWDLLSAMMQQRPLEVWTATAQMQVVGKRHYGRKAVPHGGGGGKEADRTRELFDSLLVWKARVPVDANGEADVAVPLNDSLSSFRIVAVAHGGAQKFGTGTAVLRTTQDLILLSGLPPLVREGDHYTATFTVRNTTTQDIAAQISLDSPALHPHQQTRAIRIIAGMSTPVHLDALAPIGSSALPWAVAVRADGGDSRDRLKVSERVIEAVPVRTFQATLTRLTGPLALPVAAPQGAIAGRGGINVTVQQHLSGALDGVREYMSRYPYFCIEQQASRAIALNDRTQWDEVMRRLPAYRDADGLLRYFPSEWLPGDDSLTAYVLSIADARGWPVPPDSVDAMTRALNGFVSGRIVRYSALPTSDLAIRKLAAIDALARYRKATPEMLDSISVDPQLLPTSAVLDWIDILQHLPQIPGSDKSIAQGFQILKARLNFQGTIMTFATEREDALWWLMISADSNANRMLLAAMTRPDWEPDVPRLVRGALGRQQFGHWNTTVANAWGVVAMAQFSSRFESTPVSGTTRIRYGEAQRVIDWSTTAPAEDGATTHAGGTTFTPGIGPNLGGPARVIDLPWGNGTGTLNAQQAGSGTPWVMVRATAALPLSVPLSTGYRIRRSVAAVDQQSPGRWTRGDVLRVHLDLEAQSDMSWVAVEDPVPAGATILGNGLGGDSTLLTAGARSTGAWLAFSEARADSFRAFYRFVPKGHWSLEYSVRLDNPGTFNLPGTHVEAMYAPEMLGEMPGGTLAVSARPETP